MVQLGEREKASHFVPNATSTGCDEDNSLNVNPEIEITTNVRF